MFDFKETFACDLGKQLVLDYGRILEGAVGNEIRTN